MGTCRHPHRSPEALPPLMTVARSLCGGFSAVRRALNKISPALGLGLGEPQKEKRHRGKGHVWAGAAGERCDWRGGGERGC